MLHEKGIARRDPVDFTTFIAIIHHRVGLPQPPLNPELLSLLAWLWLTAVCTYPRS